MKNFKWFLAVTTSILSTRAFANLPDRISCIHPNSPYQLVLVLKDTHLQDGVTAMGLKKGAFLVFKVATQQYTDAYGRLNFNEIPATSQSKQVIVNTATKTAILNHFSTYDLPEGSSFKCEL